MYSRRTFIKAALGVGVAAVASQVTISKARSALDSRPFRMQGCPAPPDPDSDAMIVECQQGSEGIRTFQEFSFEAEGKTRRVFYRENGPAVLVLHEGPGFTPQYVDLCQRLYQSGFTPIMPLLFGEPCERYGIYKVTFDYDFRLYASQRSHPIVHWLHALVDHLPACFSGVPTQHGIGAIGMCMTGILPLVLLNHPLVVAPVLSQPAIPIPILPGFCSELGLSPKELEAAKTRMEHDDLEVLALRFTNDWRCPGARFLRLRSEFGQRLRCCEIKSPDEDWDIDCHAHALLTDYYREIA